MASESLVLIKQLRSVPEHLAWDPPLAHGLIPIYEMAFDRSSLHILELSSSYDLQEREKIVTFINQVQPCKLIFLELNSSLLNFVEEFMAFWKKDHFPQLVFHIDENFLSLAPQWLRLQSILQQFSISFLSPTPSHHQLLQSFLHNPQERTAIFPYNPHPFTVTKTRAQHRHELGLDNQSLVIHYVWNQLSELHFSKVLETFQELHTKHFPYLELWATGPIVEKETKSIHGTQRPLLCYQEFMKKIRQLPREIKSKITFLGDKTRNELLPYLLASDVVVDLSTPPQSCFPFQILQGLMNGVPAVVSQWGGNKLFSDKDPGVFLVKVGLHKGKLDWQLNEAKEQITEALNSIKTEEDRVSLSANWNDRYLPQKLAQSLKEKLELEVPPFLYFSPLMEKICQQIHKSPLRPLQKVVTHKTSNALYQELYAGYLHS